MRATTMYFGAALHTPRGGQCPSLLRPKEGAGGQEGLREQGEGKGAKGERTTVVAGGRKGGSESERGRSTAGWRAHTSAEWKKMNKHPAREMTGRGASRGAFPLSFSRVLSLSLSLSTVVTLFQAIPRLRFTMHHADCSGGLLIPRAIPSTSKPRGNFLFLSFLHFRASHTLCFSPSFSALCHEHETYFESAHVYNKGLLRSMR